MAEATGGSLRSSDSWRRPARRDRNDRPFRAAADRLQDDDGVPRRLRTPRRRGGCDGGRTGGAVVTLVDPSQAPRLSTEAAFETLQVLEREITRVIVGQPVLIRRLLTGLFAAIPYSYKRDEIRSGCGHVLLEGVPGVAKTLTVTTLAHAISAQFQRIQLTPDMLPADILGTRIYDASTATFRIEQGPVFTNILLADEINRATPKTQSALLEAMQERQVTLAGHDLPARRSVLGAGHAEPGRAGRRLPAARGAARSLLDDAARRTIPSAADELRDAAGANVRPASSSSGRVAPADVAHAARLHPRPRPRRRPDPRVHRPARARDADTRRRRPAGARGGAACSASRRARISTSWRSRASPRSCTAATYVLPQDVKEIFCDATRHRIVRSVRAQAENVGADVMLRELLAAVPIP